MTPQPFMVRRCDPLQEQEVLALAAQGWPLAERASLWHSVRDAAAQNPQSVILLAAEQGYQLRAAQVAQILPGRVAFVWPIQWASSGPSVGWESRRGSHWEHVVKYFQNTLIDLLLQRGAAFAQSLTELHEDSAAKALELQGFIAITKLIYLVTELQEERSHAGPAALVWEDFDPRDEVRLCRLIERTYVGTQDCPWLEPLRETADVIEGYRAVGRFDPSRWQIALSGGEDVGCVLLNVHPDVQHAELVYLGLVPEVRGRGWGKELVHMARLLAVQAGCQRLVLAVDEANGPARALYVKCGLMEFGRRQLWVQALREDRRRVVT